MGFRVAVATRVDAPPERVFAAFTSADALAGWWWPHIPDTSYAFDARLGGRYAIRSEAAGIGVEGEVIRLEPARLIELTWRWLNDGVPEPEEHVAITFDADDGGTRVGVDHPLDEANESPDGIRDGWESVLGRLRERFEAR